jgi:hypothetical protein
MPPSVHYTPKMCIIKHKVLIILLILTSTKEAKASFIKDNQTWKASFKLRSPEDRQPTSARVKSERPNLCLGRSKMHLVITKHTLVKQLWSQGKRNRHYFCIACNKDPSSQTCPLQGLVFLQHFNNVSKVMC